MNLPPWANLSAEELSQRLQTNLRQGLAQEQITLLRNQYGPNRLEERGSRPWWRMLVDQFRDFMIVVLLAAAAISGLVGEAVDTIAILVIVFLNAIIGAVQEYRAERAMAALKAMEAPMARVVRDGRLDGRLPSAELVPGDLVLLEAGDAVPADLRLTECAALEVNESLLTGESQGVSKHADRIEQDGLEVADRLNMAFKGSEVNRGRARGIVVATGMQTELGNIAKLLQETVEDRTPLQKRLTVFSKRLALIVLAICALIFIVGLLRGEPVLIMFLTAVSLAVAAIPEALPAVISVSLALGAWRMIRQHALVRNLPAVETLGSVTYICTDKTGTLTLNRMTAEHFLVDGRLIDSIPEDRVELGRLLALSNDVEPGVSGSEGDPTEVALYQAAEKFGYRKVDLQKRMPRIAELPFDAERKRMSTLHRSEGKVIVYCKGAPEQLLPRCVDIDSREVLAKAEELAGRGYRVLALAMRHIPDFSGEAVADEIESELEFLALAALIDPPREEVAASVRECRNAGIVPVMITGDHPATALAVARRTGIVEQDSEVMTGDRLTKLSPAQLAERVRDIRIYARVSPEQKIIIVDALQAAGEFCAMTGDGVNDAPALKSADIGIAMGEKGTDVARQASDMVLLDDNFTTIAAAVREGRRIFDNIRKFIRYTMTSNSGEIWVLFLAPFMGLPIPLLPIHILWINLVTDGLPGLALAVEPVEPGAMKRPPRRPDESIFAGGMWLYILWMGLLIAGLSLGAMAWSYAEASANWQTLVFTVLTFCQLANVMTIRSETQTLWRQGLLSNPALLGAVSLTVALQLCVIYLPALNDIFNTRPLSIFELALCFVLPLMVLAAGETAKWLAIGNNR